MKKVILMSLIVAPFLMVGCNSTAKVETPLGTVEGSGSATAQAKKTVTITGTVPGTFIEAYCDDGTYASTNSIKNGTNKHPFSLKVPANTPCKIVMTTNENNLTNRVITPIKINGKNAVTLTGDTDMGFANIPITYDAANDKDGDHVNDTAVDVKPASLSGEAIDNNNTKNNPFDKNGNGKIDTLEDKNGDKIPDGWQDNNKNGKADIFEHTNKNSKPDSVVRIENNGSDMNQSGTGMDNNNSNKHQNETGTNGSDMNQN